MFFFKKDKTFLRDLISDDYVDIHSHMLFGIDDGAKSFEDTLFLVNSMMEFGTKAFITTPHIIRHVWENTRESITEKHKETSALLLQNGTTVPFHFACEYLMDDHFAKLFRSEPLLTLKDNYVLVEMSYINAPIQLYDILFDLQVAGYIPVLAHPERYLFYHGNFNEYAKLKRAGCKFQINLLSAIGYYGEGVFQTAKELLKRGMIDYAGSDAHHGNHIKGFSGKIEIKDLQPLKEAIANNAFFNPVQK